MKSGVCMAGWLLGCTMLAIASGALAEETRRVPEKPLTDAIQQIERQLGENPFDAVALNNLAVVKAQNGDVYPALGLLRRAAQLAPDVPAIQENFQALEKWVGKQKQKQIADGTVQTIIEQPEPMAAPPPLWQSVP